MTIVAVYIITSLMKIKRADSHMNLRFSLLWIFLLKSNKWSNRVINSIILFFRFRLYSISLSRVPLQTCLFLISFHAEASTKVVVSITSVNESKCVIASIVLFLADKSLSLYCPKHTFTISSIICFATSYSSHFLIINIKRI